MGLLMELGIFFFAIKNGWIKEKFSGYWWLVKNLSYILAERRKIQKSRVIKDREILKLFTGMIKFQDVDNLILTKLANPLLAAYFWLCKKIIFW